MAIQQEDKAKLVELFRHLRYEIDDIWDASIRANKMAGHLESYIAQLEIEQIEEEERNGTSEG